MNGPNVMRSGIVVVALILAAVPARARTEWVELCPGVEYAQFDACSKSAQGDSKITVVRVVPARVHLRVLSAADLGIPKPLRADAWAEKFDLAVVINAGMFGADWRTHLGYLKLRAEHLNNPAVRDDYKSVLVFDPQEKGPEAALVDLEHASIRELAAVYGGVVQNLRMIRSPGKVVWSPSTRKWSEAALGMDRAGRLLFIFCRTPYSMFEFSHCLLDLPLGLVAAQHLEGGGAAALVIRTPRVHKVLFGGYETTREGRDTEQGDQGSPLPNVLTISACH